MKLTCVCGATNRIPSLPTSRIRCGKCKHEFAPRELARAVPEPPDAFNLIREVDIGLGADPGDPYYACEDEFDCGWEGPELELGANHRCPECNAPTVRVN